MLMTLQKEIKIARKKSLCTQEEMASELNVAFSTVNRWEAGKAKPSMTAMKSIKKFCNDHSVAYDKIESAWIKEGEEER